MDGVPRWIMKTSRGVFMVQRGTPSIPQPHRLTIAKEEREREQEKREKFQEERARRDRDKKEASKGQGQKGNRPPPSRPPRRQEADPHAAPPSKPLSRPAGVCGSVLGAVRRLQDSVCLGETKSGGRPSNRGRRIMRNVGGSLWSWAERSQHRTRDAKPPIQQNPAKLSYFFSTIEALAIIAPFLCSVVTDEFILISCWSPYDSWCFYRFHDENRGVTQYNRSACVFVARPASFENDFESSRFCAPFLFSIQHTCGRSVFVRVFFGVSYAITAARPAVSPLARRVPGVSRRWRGVVFWLSVVVAVTERPRTTNTHPSPAGNYGGYGFSGCPGLWQPLGTTKYLHTFLSLERRPRPRLRMREIEIRCHMNMKSLGSAVPVVETWANISNLLLKRAKNAGKRRNGLRSDRKTRGADVGTG